MPDGSTAQTLSMTAAKEVSSGKKVSRCDFRHTGRLTSVQSRSVTALLEGFARNVARALAAYLRVSMECTLVTVEQAPYRDVLARLPELAYVATFAATGDRSSGLLQMDLNIAFPVIDLLLGGEGKPENRLRELTEIEEQVLEGVVRIVCHELAPAWQPLGVSFEFQGREPLANLNKLMAPEERTLTVSFEIAMPEVKGALSLIFPGLLSNALLRRLARDWEYQRPKVASGNDRMRELLMDCGFTFELNFGEMKVPAAELVSLSVGQVLGLRRGVQQLATASVGDVPMFSGTAARSGARRAAQIEQAQGIGNRKEEAERWRAGEDR